MDDIEATLMAFFNENSSPNHWGQDSITSSISPEVMTSSPENIPREPALCQPFQTSSAVGCLPSVETKREQSDFFLNDFFHDDDDGIIVKVNQDEPDYSVAVPQDYGTSWLDDLSSVPMPSNLDGFDVDFDSMLQECGWDDNNTGNVTWKNSNPTRMLDVEGPGLVDETAVANLRSSLKTNLASAWENSARSTQSHNSQSQPFWGSVFREPEPLVLATSSPEALHDLPTLNETIVPLISSRNGCNSTATSINSDRETPPQRLKQWEQKCDICGLILLGGQQRFEAHMKNAHEIWCACGMSFKSKAKATNHIKMMTRTEASDSPEHRIIPGGKIKPMFECDFCDEIFRHRNLAVRHRNVVHLNMPENVEHKRTYRKKFQGVDSPPQKMQKMDNNSHNAVSTKISSSCGGRPGKLAKGKNLSASASGARHCVVTPLPLPPISQIRSKNDCLASLNNNSPREQQMLSFSGKAGFNGGTIISHEECSGISCGPGPGAIATQHMGILRNNTVNMPKNDGNNITFPHAADMAIRPPSVAFNHSFQAAPSKGRRRTTKTIDAFKKRPKSVSASTTVAQINVLFDEPKPPGWIYCSHQPLPE